MDKVFIKYRTVTWPVLPGPVLGNPSETGGSSVDSARLMAALLSSLAHEEATTGLPSNAAGMRADAELRYAEYLIEALKARLASIFPFTWEGFEYPEVHVVPGADIPVVPEDGDGELVVF